MKSNSFSRRGLLMGAATLAVSRLKAAGETRIPMMVMEDISPTATFTPPYAYVGCYTGGTNARGISVLHYDPNTNELTLVGIVAPVNSPSFVVLDTPKKFL